MACLEGIVSSIERDPRDRKIEHVTIRISRGRIDDPIQHFYIQIPRDQNPFMESDPVKITQQEKDTYLIQRVDEHGKTTVSYEGPGRKAA